MGKPGQRKLRALLVALSALTIVAAALVLEGLLAEDTLRTWPWFLKNREKTPGVSRITYVEKFLRCGDTITAARDVPEDEVSGVIAGLSPEWRATFGGDRGIEVLREIDDYCSSHRDYRFIALYRDSPGTPAHVCVFRGRKADPAFLIKERRDLTESLLYPRERESLWAGVEVSLVPEDSLSTDLDGKVDSYLQGVAEGR